MAQQTDVVPPVAEEVEKTKAEETPVAVEEESKSENGDSSTENGDAVDKENGKEETEEKTEEESAPETEKSSIKRKSVGGGDATDGAPAEGATPEKKAKLDEAAEPELNGKSEVAA